jgi:hypothetical protein
MGNLLTILLSIMLIAVNGQKNDMLVAGDLYFKSIDFERFFDWPDSILTKLEMAVKTGDKDTLDDTGEKNLHC